MIVIKLINYHINRNKNFIIILFISLLLGGTAHADIQVLDCRQIIEVDDDVGKDIVIKHIAQIDLENEAIKVTYPNGDGSSYEISNVAEESIEAIRKADNGTSAISIHRYTLELTYYFFNEDAVLVNQSSPFECKKLEQKI